MNPFVTLALTLVSLIFFVAYFIISKSNYHERFKMTYDIRNTYPFELNYKGKFSDNLIGNLLLILFFLTSVANYTMFDMTHSGFMIFVMIAGIFSCIMIALENFVPLKLLKGHIATAVFTFVAGFMVPASISIASYYIYHNLKYNLALAAFIVAIILCLFIFILIMNPNLTHWAKAEKQVQPDGTVKYVRPKYFVLAFSEWLTIFVIVTSQIPLLLMTLSLFYKI